MKMPRTYLSVVALILFVLGASSPSLALPFEEPREEITGFEGFQFGMSMDEVNKLINFDESIELVDERHAAQPYQLFGFNFQLSFNFNENRLYSILLEYRKDFAGSDWGTRLAKTHCDHIFNGFFQFLQARYGTPTSEPQFLQSHEVHGSWTIFGSRIGNHISMAERIPNNNHDLCVLKVLYTYMK